MRLLKSKRGVAEILQDIVGFFGIMVLLVIFVVIFSVLGKVNQFSIDGEEIRFETESTFMNIMQKEVFVDNQKMDLLTYLIYAKSSGGQERSRSEGICSKILDEVGTKTGLYGTITIIPIEENHKTYPSQYAQGPNILTCKFSGTALLHGFGHNTVYQDAISNSKGTSSVQVVVPGLINGSSYSAQGFFVRGVK